MVPRRRDRGRPMWRWTQHIEVTVSRLGMRVYEAGGLASSPGSFGHDVKRATFRKSHVTLIPVRRGV